MAEAGRDLCWLSTPLLKHKHVVLVAEKRGQKAFEYLQEWSSLQATLSQCLVTLTMKTVSPSVQIEHCMFEIAYPGVSSK